jgi:hypothetical protein
VAWDDNEGALQDLDTQLAELNVPRSIALEDAAHKDKIPRKPDGSG